MLRGVTAIGLFRSQKSMPTESVAAAMIAIAKTKEEVPMTVSGQDILKYTS